MILIPAADAAAKTLQLCPTRCEPMAHSHRLLCLWNSPGKNTGMGCHAFLQGIFQTQGSLHWQADSFPLVPPANSITATLFNSKEYCEEEMT